MNGGINRQTPARRQCDAFRASHPHNSLQMALYTLLPVYGLAIGLFVWLAAVLRRREARQGADQ